MTDEGTLTFVPSVHFSPTHRRRVRETIRDVDPDVVAVELGEDRYERLERRDHDYLDLARDVPPATAAAVATLRTVQRSVVRLYGLDPESTDMETAIETAADLETEVALIDEPIGDTVAALADVVGPDTLPSMLLRFQRLGPGARVGQLEALTLPFRSIESGDDVQPVIDQLRELLPEVTAVLIDRRDRAMAERLHALRRRGLDVVAVVGAGHHNGILAALDDLDAQTEVPDVDVPIREPGRTATRIPIN